MTAVDVTTNKAFEKLFRFMSPSVPWERNLLAGVFSPQQLGGPSADQGT